MLHSNHVGFGLGIGCPWVIWYRVVLNHPPIETDARRHTLWG